MKLHGIEIRDDSSKSHQDTQLVMTVFQMMEDIDEASTKDELDVLEKENNGGVNINWFIN